jgi:hypothetical protein
VDTKTEIYERITIYQTAMDHEQSFRSLFIQLLVTMQGILFATAIALAQLSADSATDYSHHTWALAAAAIVFCLAFGSVSEYRARNVDTWRKLIVMALLESHEHTEIRRAFYEGKYRWSVARQTWLQMLFQYVVGHWLEKPFVFLLICGWSVLLYGSSCPVVLQVLIGLSSLLWFAYVWGFLAFVGGRMSDGV